MNNMQT